MIAPRPLSPWIVPIGGGSIAVAGRPVAVTAGQGSGTVTVWVVEGPEPHLVRAYPAGWPVVGDHVGTVEIRNPFDPPAVLAQVVHVFAEPQ
ncbi:MAG TPA: hypothetical protein VKA83_22265 [Methylomirabilota bacterium]|nr:hypothetical protein [Methylomirabilota bacterium]